LRSVAFRLTRKSAIENGITNGFHRPACAPGSPGDEDEDGWTGRARGEAAINNKPVQSHRVDYVIRRVRFIATETAPGRSREIGGDPLSGSLPLNYDRPIIPPPDIVCDPPPSGCSSEITVVVLRYAAGMHARLAVNVSLEKNRDCVVSARCLITTLPRVQASAIK